MKTAFACALAVAFLAPVVARAITIDTVPIGNPEQSRQDVQTNGHLSAA